MRVFLDANVLFSAAKSPGAMRSMLERLRAVGHTSYADGYVIAEARRNLEAKGRGAVDALDVVLRLVEVAPFQPAASTEGATDMLPEKDRPVLLAAIRLRCDALVTGDRTHFGLLYGKTIQGVTIYSPRSLAETLAL
ncbi:MAG: PIN domain-containing protein [Thermoanaerobaculia bacterium]